MMPSTFPDLTREQWRVMHDGCIGSSSAAAACGVDRHKSALRLFHEMRGNLPPEDLSHNDAVYFGSLFESAILAAYMRTLGGRIVHDRAEVAHAIAADDGCEIVGWHDGQPFVRSKARPWQVTTIDALAVRDGAYEIVEAKNQGEHRYEWSSDEGAPQEYRIQARHHLAVITAVPQCTLFAVVGGNKPRHMEICRDATVESLSAVEAEFLHRVRQGIEPDADGSDDARRALRDLHPDDNGATVVLPSEVLRVHERLSELWAEEARIGAQLAPIEHEIDALEQIVRQRIGPSTYGRLPNGAGIYSLKTTPRRAYAVEEASYRQLRFKENK